MATNVVMPQMGESIAEGTIVRWIKKVGDAVDRDEPLFEISTDKVDAEIPSPAAGVLTDIKVFEGETVPVNSVVAVIGAAGEAAAAARPSAEETKVADKARAGAAVTARATRGSELPAAAVGQPETGPRGRAAVSQFPQSRGAEAARAPQPTQAASARAATKEELRRQKSSPLV